MSKKIYLVGGSVRDMIMGIPNSDKDYVAIGYSEEDFSHLQKVGKSFPVFLDKDGSQIALARVEKKIAKGYNGFSVDTKNISLEDDLKRRDITINSIAFDEDSKKYIDPFNGIEDIKKKVLKHTSEAFCEDPIRVLRIARFRAKYGYEWKIDPSTKVLIYNMKDELKYLESNRVYKEIEKVLKLPNSYIFFNTLFELGVLEDIFPSLYKLTTLKEGSIYHLEASVFEHSMMLLKNLSASSELLKLTALYHDIAKPYCYRKYGNSAKHDNIEIVESLIDINLPLKLKKQILILIQNHIKIFLLEKMRPSKIATFFEQFKKNRKLLEELLIFCNIDNISRITLEEKKCLDNKAILNTFDKINAYSPKQWITTSKNKPSNNAIKEHIHKYNIYIVKKYFLNL